MQRTVSTLVPTLVASDLELYLVRAANWILELRPDYNAGTEWGMVIIR